jgi:Zn-dependent protease with chaperone function
VDPTRFPSDTRLRVWLVLLILGTVGLFFAYATALPDLAETDQRCAAAAWQAVPGAADNSREAARWADAWTACRAPALRESGLSLAGGLDFLMIAVGVYSAQVLWRLRRRGLRPLTGPDSARVSAVVAEYGRAAALRHTPLVFYDVRPGAQPTTFGKASQPILAVGQGTLTDLVHDRRRFDAVIHHELFHFVGDDVSTYYRALAFFRALCVQTAAFGLLFAGGLVVLLGEVWQGITLLAQCAAILGLGLAALRDYLRRREFRADMWAVDRTGDAEAVERALGAASVARRSWVPRIFHTHPSPGERIDALRQRGRALRFTLGAALLTAASVGLLVPTLTLYLPLLGSVWLTNHQYAIAGAVGGAFLGRILAIGIWRNAHLALIGGTRVPTGVRTGLVAAAGLVAGGLLPLNLTFDAAGPGIAFKVLPLATVLIAMLLFCTWVAACARLRLGIHATVLDGRAYRWGLRFATALGAALVATVAFIAGLYRTANAYSRLGQSDLPRPADALQLSAERLARHFLGGLWHDWRAYALVALAFGWLFAARVAAWRSPSPRQRTPGHDRSPAVAVASPPPDPAATPAAPAERRDAVLSAAAVIDLVENESIVRSVRPPTSGWRLWAAWALSGLALVVLVAVASTTSDVVFLTVTGVAALLLAWRAYLGHPSSRRLLAVVYAGCLLAGVVSTVPSHRWQDLSLIAVGIIGTAGYTRLRMPVPGERHTFTVLAGALMLHHNIWILLSWLLIGPLIGLLLRPLLRPPQGELEPPLWLGFAIGGIACLAIEVALR